MRSPYEVTLSVWKALFLRETLNRVFRERAAWLWLLLEPIAHVVFLVFILVVIRVRVIGGIDTTIWALVGLTTFFMFRRPAQQAMNAISANHPLFGFRQVKPVDTVLVRAGVEGLLMIIVALILFAGAGLAGFDVVPDDPLGVIGAAFAMWLIAVGYGLITSVITELLPQVGRIISLTQMPLYFLSGVIFPIARLPSQYREWLALNPLAHGLEAARLAFASHYKAMPELNVAYMYGCALVSIFLGLALHRRYAVRLAAQ